MVRLMPILLAPVVLLGAQPNSAEEWRSIGLASISDGNLKGAVPALQKGCELERAPEIAVITMRGFFTRLATSKL